MLITNDDGSPSGKPFSRTGRGAASVIPHLHDQSSEPGTPVPSGSDAPESVPAVPQATDTPAGESC